jgi:predicted transcriptional regulator
MLEKIQNLQNEITNTIKILIYKEAPSILEKLNFEDDDVFLEPLLFIYFNDKKLNLFSSQMLFELMQGYFIDKEINLVFDQSLNRNDISYLPNIGYFYKNENQPFEKIELIQDTKIEVIKYHINLLDNIFNNTKEGITDVNKIIIDNEVFKLNINYLTKALNLIKENSYEHFQIIEQCCKKIILFKTNPENTNSFATINAHGIAFLNVYQDDYNVVFFVDDIAHQTGHIILTTLFHERKSIFKINENENIGVILRNNDYRSFYTLFHALYTYYTTLLCLDDCLENNSFSGIEKDEAIGRIGFYLKKCSVDLSNFDIYLNHYNSIGNVLTNDGIETYEIIRNKYIEINNKWNNITSKLKYTNQTYNFTFSIFVNDNK